jgi:hypothetical protein
MPHWKIMKYSKIKSNQIIWLNQQWSLNMLMKSNEVLLHHICFHFDFTIITYNVEKLENDILWIDQWLIFNCYHEYFFLDSSFPISVINNDSSFCSEMWPSIQIMKLIREYWKYRNIILTKTQNVILTVILNSISLDQLFNS